MTKILIKRGNKTNLPVLNNGEPAYVADEKELYIGTSTGNVKLTNNLEITAMKNSIDDYVAFKARGGVISGPIQGTSGTSGHTFLEHTGVFGDRNVKNTIKTATADSSSSIMLSSYDTQNDYENGIMFTLGKSNPDNSGDGATVFRPIKPNSSPYVLENTLGSLDYRWDSLYLRNGVIGANVYEMSIEAKEYCDIKLFNSRASLVFKNDADSYGSDLVPENGTISLGRESYPFKEVYLDTARHSDGVGYQKLPNGLILTWGTVYGEYTDSTWYYFPLQFHEIYNISVTVLKNGLYDSTSCYVLRYDGSGFMYACSDNRAFMWMALGK